MNKRRKILNVQIHTTKSEYRPPPQRKLKQIDTINLEYINTVCSMADGKKSNDKEEEEEKNQHIGNMKCNFQFTVDCQNGKISCC